MESASTYLVTLAGRIAAAYRTHAKPAAILLTGSAAEGTSDYYSDLDLIMYYDTLPSDAECEAAHARIGASNVRLLGPPSDEQRGEAFALQGVECQIGHATIAAWERDMDAILVGLDVTSPIQKAVSGLIAGVPLHGEARIRQWQARAAIYPEGLARAMVAHHLRVFPIWYIQEYIVARDARLWTQQIIVESAFSILGVLAGLNRRYYSSFQFKRLRAFIATLHIVPDDLSARLEALLIAEPGMAITQLEGLVQETVVLVNRHMPEIDTALLVPRLGERHQPWEPERESGHR